MTNADEASDLAAPPLQMPATTVTELNANGSIGEGGRFDPTPTGMEVLTRSRDLGSHGDLPGALQVLDRGLELYPNDTEILQQRAYVRNQLGDPKGAIEDDDKAISLRPNYGVAYCNRGIAEIAAGENHKAIEDLSVAIVDYGGFSLFRGYRARAEENLGLYDDAMADLDFVVHCTSTADPAYGERAIFRYERGDINGALDDFGTAVRLTQHGGLWLRGLANLQARTGDVRAALATFGKALALSPQDPDLFLDRGSLQLENHHVSEARSDFAAALVLRPHDARAHYLLGQVLHATGDDKAAVADYDAAAAGNAPNALLLEGRGLARLGLKDIAGVAADFKQSTVVDPTFAKAWVDRAWLEDRRGNLLGAVEGISRAIAAAQKPVEGLEVPDNRRKDPPTNYYGDLIPVYPDFSGEVALPKRMSPAWLYMLRATEEAKLKHHAQALADARTSVSLESHEANRKLLAHLEEAKPL